MLNAGDLQVWNTTEFNVFQTGRWKLEAFGVVRARERVGNAYDRRLGSLLRYSITPRFGLGVGQMRRWFNADGSGIRPHNRFFGGPTVIVANSPVRIESVTLVENHRFAEDPFMRYRQRFEVEVPRRGWAPFFFAEMVFRNGHGPLRSRNYAALRRRLPHGRRIDIGYQFESIKVHGAWIPRHSIRTTVALGTLFQGPN